MVETLFSGAVRDFLSYSSNPVGEFPLTYRNGLVEGEKVEYMKHNQCYVGYSTEPRGARKWIRK
jgi:hypothetical protein